ncbi:MAG: metallophosphoesterase family protein [Patescibacteria group bacterium]
MKVAIISDSHDNVPNIEKFMSWARKNKIKQIIHCGDVSAPSMISLVFMKNYSGQLDLVYGNVGDWEVLKKVCSRYKNVKFHGNIGKLTADGQKIAFCHFPEEARKLAESGKYGLVFYGHTHKPWIEKIGNCQMVNPGTLGGVFQKACFAVYETKTGSLELKILERI